MRDGPLRELTRDDVIPSDSADHLLLTCGPPPTPAPTTMPSPVTSPAATRTPPEYPPFTVFASFAVNDFDLPGRVLTLTRFFALFVLLFVATMFISFSK